MARVLTIANQTGEVKYIDPIFWALCIAYTNATHHLQETVSLPDGMVPLWKILHLAGADWTYGSSAWAGENYCMFLADDDGWQQITEATVRKAEELGCSVYLNTECGHSTFSVNQGIRRVKLDTSLNVTIVVHFYARWIREGRLRPSSAWNKDLKMRFTVQDPCNQVRKEYGDEYADDLRFVVKACVGEENFVDMTPNKSNNYCWGGGGGYLQSGFNEERHLCRKVRGFFDVTTKETPGIGYSDWLPVTDRSFLFVIMTSI